jgi:Zn-dependent protease
MNLLLAVLNLIPLPPLDGSAAILLLMPEGVANRYQRMVWSSPMLGVVGMLAAWRVIDAAFYPIFWMTIRLLYPDASYG